MAVIRLDSLQATSDLAKKLAEALTEFQFPPVLLHGQLGSGKTALIRCLMENFENCDEFEISSPSFNIYNIYPASPQVMHADLYRCMGAVPEEIADALNNNQMLVLIEWAEFLPQYMLPENYLDITIKLTDNFRLAEIEVYGKNSKAILKALQ